MLQQSGYTIKIIRDVISKAINRNQNSNEKTLPNQQESTKHYVFFKLQFIDRISIQIENETRDFFMCV